jgi:hypothetical protein
MSVRFGRGNGSFWAFYVLSVLSSPLCLSEGAKIGSVHHMQRGSHLFSNPSLSASPGHTPHCAGLAHRASLSLTHQAL